MSKRKKPPDTQSQKITDFFKPEPTENVTVHSTSTEQGPSSWTTLPQQQTSSSASPTIRAEQEQPPKVVKKPKKHQRSTVPPRRSCNKTRLKTYLRTDHPSSDVYKTRLLNYITKPHRLAKHATEFIKFWFLSSANYPALTESHVEGVLYMLNKGSAWEPKAELKLAIKAEILPFIQPYQKIRKIQPINMDHDQQPINYLAKSIFANIKTNVQEHYMQMLLRFINLRVGESSFFE